MAPTREVFRPISDVHACARIYYTMRTTMTISLPPKLQREVAKAARRDQITLSEYVRKAIQDKLWEDAFDTSRRAALPRAQAQGIYTDEDVFKLIS